MPPNNTIMPLPDTDHVAMNCPRNDFYDRVYSLPEKTQQYIANTTHRLAEIDWITRTLEDQVRSDRSPVTHEGLLSLQVYLLLTCADTLGHLSAGGRVGARFRGFFENLPSDAKQNLFNNLLVWRTNVTELNNVGLRNAATNTITYPSRQQVSQIIQPLSLDERLSAVIDFLYLRRNHYTHESDYPQLGFHPNLAVMHRQRLNVPNTPAPGEIDRLQMMNDKNNIYFVYYKTDDVIATIRWSIVRGVGQIIGYR